MHSLRLEEAGGAGIPVPRTEPKLRAGSIHHGCGEVGMAFVKVELEQEA